jgi:hypothetical protein
MAVGCHPDGFWTRPRIIATITNEQDGSRFRAAMLGAESLLAEDEAQRRHRLDKRSETSGELMG